MARASGPYFKLQKRRLGIYNSEVLALVAAAQVLLVYFPLPCLQDVAVLGRSGGGLFCSLAARKVARSQGGDEVGKGCVQAAEDQQVPSSKGLAQQVQAWLEPTPDQVHLSEVHHEGLSAQGRS